MCIVELRTHGQMVEANTFPLFMRVKFTNCTEKKALDSQDSPPIGKAIIESHVGYHIREGGHSIESFDWKRFLDFADYHLK